MALSKQKILKGTVLKMAITFSYHGDKDLSLEDINFFTEWYCSSKKMKIEKADHIFEDGACFAFVDTAQIGTGQLKMRLWADVPDYDTESGVRAEYAEYATDIVIS